MSRLIDVDKAENDIVENVTTKAVSRVVAILQGQPTVKAIPIKWIKNYARHKASKGFTEIDCYWQFWEDDVLKMVADWEKENADNN